NFFAGKAGGGEALGSGLRIEDDGIAKAEDGELRAELEGCEEVAELAMTADDDGNAGKPGDGDHGEVGVEVERVGDLDAMAAKIVGELEAAAHGAPFHQAGAERKFWDGAEFGGKRAASIDAAGVNTEFRCVDILRED